jgi:hypothetical protein
MIRDEGTVGGSSRLDPLGAVSPMAGDGFPHSPLWPEYALSGTWGGVLSRGRGWAEVRLGEAWGDLLEGRFEPTNTCVTLVNT